jgi:hypothetical protein
MLIIKLSNLFATPNDVQKINPQKVITDKIDKNNLES